MEHDCCCRKKHRTDAEVRRLVNRLSRIEGQIRGLKSMIESDAYCIDVLTQSAAASSALAAFERELLNAHISSCVAGDIAAGRTEKSAELAEVLKRLVK